MSEQYSETRGNEGEGLALRRTSRFMLKYKVRDTTSRYNRCVKESTKLSGVMIYFENW